MIAVIFKIQIAKTAA